MTHCVYCTFWCMSPCSLFSSVAHPPQCSTKLGPRIIPYFKDIVKLCVGLREPTDSSGEWTQTKVFSVHIPTYCHIRNIRSRSEYLAGSIGINTTILGQRRIVSRNQRLSRGRGLDISRVFIPNGCLHQDIDQEGTDEGPSPSSL